MHKGSYGHLRVSLIIKFVQVFNCLYIEIWSYFLWFGVQIHTSMFLIMIRLFSGRNILLFSLSLILNLLLCWFKFHFSLRTFKTSILVIELPKRSQLTVLVFCKLFYQLIFIYPILIGHFCYMWLEYIS